MAQFQIQLIISCANQTDEKIIYHFTFKKLKYFFHYLLTTLEEGVISRLRRFKYSTFFWERCSRYKLEKLIYKRKSNS